MSNPHVLQELSAYLDGESREPERIARHLQSCPACARRHMELLKISARLQAMKAPEVHPAFLTRVMARTVEAPPARSWIASLAPRFAAAACVIGLGLAAVWQWQAPIESSAPIVPAAAPMTINMAWQDDARVLEEFGRLLDAGVALDLFGDVDEASENDEPAAVALESVLEILAEDSANEEFSDPFATEDLTGLLDALADEDVQVLGELLQAHESEV